MNRNGLPMCVVCTWIFIRVRFKMEGSIERNLRAVNSNWATFVVVLGTAGGKNISNYVYLYKIANRIICASVRAFVPDSNSKKKIEWKVCWSYTLVTIIYTAQLCIYNRSLSLSLSLWLVWNEELWMLHCSEIRSIRTNRGPTLRTNWRI